MPSPKFSSIWGVWLWTYSCHRSSWGHRTWWSLAAWLSLAFCITSPSGLLQYLFLTLASKSTFWCSLSPLPRVAGGEEEREVVSRTHPYARKLISICGFIHLWGGGNCCEQPTQPPISVLLWAHKPSPNFCQFALSSLLFQWHCWNSKCFTSFLFLIFHVILYKAQTSGGFSYPHRASLEVFLDSKVRKAKQKTTNVITEVE